MQRSTAAAILLALLVGQTANAQTSPLAGPQSPRDLGVKAGTNKQIFAHAPAYRRMNLCNIHFHKSAEHKGGDFTTPAPNGKGFVYDGAATRQQTGDFCKGLKTGDTIELHYVFSTAAVSPGPGLAACTSPAIANPQLRVEAQVMVLVDDPKAADFARLTEIGTRDAYHQALNMPRNTGRPIAYAGSTTGPEFNDKESPLQVWWSVRPRTLKVDAASVGRWCQANIFNEDHAHGVRDLVTDPARLSPIR